DAVAALRDVADARGGTADGGALRVGGAARPGTGGGLGDIADAGGRAADHRGRLEGIRGAGGGHAVAGLRTVARARGRPALQDRAADAVHRAVAAGAVAALGEVAVARGGTAHGPARLVLAGGRAAGSR